MTVKILFGKNATDYFYESKNQTVAVARRAAKKYDGALCNFEINDFSHSAMDDFVSAILAEHAGWDEAMIVEIK